MIIYLLVPIIGPILSIEFNNETLVAQKQDASQNKKKKKKNKKLKCAGHNHQEK